MRPACNQCRILLATSAGIGVLALGLAKIEADSPILTAVRLALGFFTVGFAPGLLLVLAGGWGRRLSGLTVLGLAAILSLSLAQLLCGLALALHITCHTLTVGLTFATVAGAVALMIGWRRKAQPLIFWPRRERWLLASLLVLAASLYPKGSPVYAITFEDFWHLSLISRLAGSQAPTITATFVEPGLAFTHPISGMHFFMAMIANASGEEFIFVFNKMRSFAGLLAPLFLYLIAKRIFARPATATWACAGVLVLVLTGSLADTTWHWGQAAPVSHNTDLVMGMLVPGVLWMVLATLAAPPGRRHRWWFTATGALFVVLICSHVREAPQVLLYLAMFVATMFRYPTQGRRALALALLLAAMIYGYQQWHHGNVPQITEHVTRQRQALETTMRGMHGGDWWRSPIAVYPIRTLWQGWHALLIVALPLTLITGGRRREALGVVLCFGCALLLIRVPAFSLAVNWATYDEILMFPVRFFTPFSLLAPGALAWSFAGGLSLRGQIIWRVFALLGVTSLVLGHRFAEAVVTQQPDLFFGAALLSVIVALRFVLRKPAIGFTQGITVRRSLTTAGLLTGIGLLTANITASPFGWLTPEGQAPNQVLRHKAGALWRWRDVIENLKDAPPPGLLSWIRRNVPPDEVIISNPAGNMTLTGFVPNPGYGWAIVYRMGLNTPMRSVHAESYARNGGPPFFNLQETTADRLALCRRLGARTIVLDPSQATHFKPVLEANPKDFVRRYQEAGWLVYSVNLDPAVAR
jgi:hypothetical protein